jgi:HK97 family phage major capsid protein
MASLENEMAELSEREHITPAENRRLDQLLAEHTRRRSARLAKVEAIRSTPGLEQHAGYDDFGIVSKPSTSAVFNGEARNRAEARDLGLRALEHVSRSAEVVPEAERAIREGDRFAEQFRAQSAPEYLSAWCKLVTAGDPAAAMFRMSDVERSAMARVSEARAMSGDVDTAGAYGIPTLVDPSFILTNDGSVNPMRQVARVVRGVSNKWRGITTAGSSASWDAQLSEVSDDAPEIGKVDIEAYTGRVFIPVSDELDMDYENLAAELRRVLVDARDRLEATAFISGNGTSAPEGILTNLDANTNVEVSVATAGALVAADLYNVFAQLPARYRSNAAWLASLDVVNEIRQIGDDKINTQTVNMSGDYDFRLLGRPVLEASDMPAWSGTSGAANITVVGDFAAGYVIFDRMGASTVSVIPHLLGANGRPNGSTGFYHSWRVGGGVVNPSAFRLLTNT